MQNYTIRPVYWPHKLSLSGTAPIMIAITITRKIRYFKTGLKVRPEEWKDGQVRGHPNAGLYNRAIREKIADLEAGLLARCLAGEDLTARTVKANRLDDLFLFAIDVQKNAAPATRRRYGTELARLKAYAGARLGLREVTAAFLRDYERHERERGMAQNTLNTTARWIKSVLNKAHKEGLLHDLPAYQTPKYIQPERIYLVEEERQDWLKYWRERKVEGTLYDTLTWFLFGCYSGLRFSDWAQFDASTRIEGEFLKLRAKKNGRWVVMPIGKTLAEIIAVLKDLPKPLSGDKTRAHLKILAGRVGTIRNITTHTCRHTAGAMFAQLGLPLAVAAELLGISEDVCKVYFHLTGRDIIGQAAVLKDV